MWASGRAGAARPGRPPRREPEPWAPRERAAQVAVAFAGLIATLVGADARDRTPDRPVREVE
ncbi:hypothetical protein [Nocardiopsis sp. YSL2]|uniref:hypothetical protein n=1 Tax=Nocardiopsis sp. YSL2 TaxID=2939492 RepID=UPI0026F44DC9|nr:hypothetical protein [Nocardiopsis sp. YSL2]